MQVLFTLSELIETRVLLLVKMELLVVSEVEVAGVELVEELLVVKLVEWLAVMLLVVTRNVVDVVPDVV